jgi:hypothetical protein
MLTNRFESPLLFDSVGDRPTGQYCRSNCTRRPRPLQSICVLIFWSVFARSGRLTIKAPPEHLREYNDPSWHVPQVLQLSRKNPALFRKPSDSRVLCNSVHDFFDCLQILCESAFIWISEDCGTTGCGLRLRLKRPTPHSQRGSRTFNDITKIKNIGRFAAVCSIFVSTSFHCFPC